MTLLESTQAAEAEGTISGAGELLLRLDGFAGSIDLLLELARTHRIDLRSLDLLALVEQMIRATREAANTPLSRKADWVVTAAWLLLLRSHLMLPAGDARQKAAAAQADRLRGQLLSAQEARALARWLDERPQLGRDVFARGVAEPDLGRTSDRAGFDRIEFLWGCIALFEGDWKPSPPEILAVYVPPVLDLYSVEDARDRVRRHMEQEAAAQAIPLSALLPIPEREWPVDEREQPAHRIRHRSGWTSTLIACLEMAKQGDVVLAQDDSFAPIQVSAGVAGLPAGN